MFNFLRGKDLEQVDKKSEEPIVLDDSSSPEIEISEIEEVSENPSSGSETLTEKLTPSTLETVKGEASLESEIEQVNNPSFIEKIHEKMTEVYKKSVDAKTYKNFYEKVKTITWGDIKDTMSEEMENEIVKVGGKISYDTASTLLGTKAITDWGMFALHKLGVKSTIKGDVHKYFAENDMERALLGITNKAIDLRQKIEGKGAEKDSEINKTYKESSAALAAAGRDFKLKVDNLNVPEEKKKELRREFGLIMKEHKFQEAEISKGESEKFDQLMRNYTGNKVNAFKLGKDGLNSALTFSGFMVARGISYLGLSALEKGKESWDKFSREKYEAEKKAADSPEDYPDWKSTYKEISSEKFKSVLKDTTVNAAKETCSELVKGRKNWELGDKEREKKEEKESEKSENLENLKQQLEDEGKNLFGKTWRVAWHKVKNAEVKELVKENLVRLQALGKIVRVVGVSFTGVQAYSSEGSAFKDAYDSLISDINEKGLFETSTDNMFSRVDKLSNVFDKEKWEHGLNSIKEGVERTWSERHEIADAGFRKTIDVVGATLSPDSSDAEEKKLSAPTPTEIQEAKIRFDKVYSKTIDETKKSDAVQLRELIKSVKERNSGKSILEMSEKDRKIMQESFRELNKLEKDRINSFNKLNGGHIGEKAISDVEEKGVAHVDEKVEVRSSAQTENNGGEKVETFEIARDVKIRKGDSIWTVAEKYLQGNKDFSALKGDGRLREALDTYNIDRIKDKLVERPNNYGLSKALERILGDEYRNLSEKGKENFWEKLRQRGKSDSVFKKLTKNDLALVDWQKAFDNTFMAKSGITETLSEDKVEGVLASNKAMHNARFHRNHVGSAKPEAIKATSSVAPEVQTLEEVEKIVVPVNEAIKDDSEVIDNGLRIKADDDQFLYEWKVWKNLPAAKSLEGDFGEPLDSHPSPVDTTKGPHEQDIVFKQRDGAESSHMNKIQARLDNARDLMGKPFEGETNQEYFDRYNIKNAEVNYDLSKALNNAGVLKNNADYDSKILKIVDGMPSALKHAVAGNFNQNKNIINGYINIFSGHSDGIKEGFKEMFSYQGEVNPKDLEMKSNGSVIWKNAFGKNNYDLIVSRDKVGVDGPLTRNWNKNGTLLTLGSIEDSKNFIKIDSQNDMGKMVNEYLDLEKPSGSSHEIGHSIPKPIKGEVLKSDSHPESHINKSIEKKMNEAKIKEIVRLRDEIAKHEAVPKPVSEIKSPVSESAVINNEIKKIISKIPVERKAEFDKYVSDNKDLNETQLSMKIIDIGVDKNIPDKEKGFAINALNYLLKKNEASGMDDDADMVKGVKIEYTDMENRK